MKSLRKFPLAVCIASFWFPACGQDDHGHGRDHPESPAAANEAEAAPPANPVQAEMRALHVATRDWVTAVANNELDQIPASIHTVHAAREVTEQALRAGTYAPPKNSDRLEEFEREDEAFHDQLVVLLRAAKADDLPAATHQLGVVLDGCTNCHAQFRF